MKRTIRPDLEKFVTQKNDVIAEAQQNIRDSIDQHREDEAKLLELRMVVAFLTGALRVAVGKTEADELVRTAFNSICTKNPLPTDIN